MRGIFIIRKDLYPERDLNPHALMDTWPSTMPVDQFQHPGNCAFGVNFQRPKDNSGNKSNLAWASFDYAKKLSSG